MGGDSREGGRRGVLGRRWGMGGVGAGPEEGRCVHAQLLRVLSLGGFLSPAQPALRCTGTPNPPYGGICPGVLTRVLNWAVRKLCPLRGPR